MARHLEDPQSIAGATFEALWQASLERYPSLIGADPDGAKLCFAMGWKACLQRALDGASIEDALGEVQGYLSARVTASKPQEER